MDSSRRDGDEFAIGWREGHGHCCEFSESGLRAQLADERLWLIEFGESWLRKRGHCRQLSEALLGDRYCQFSLRQR